METNLIGLFYNEESASRVVEELLRSGIQNENVRMIAWDGGREGTAKRLTTDRMVFIETAGDLHSFGILDEQTQDYFEGIRRGGVLVQVAGNEEQIPLARRLLEKANPIDIHRLRQTWMAGGWGGREIDQKAEYETRPGKTPDASQDPADVHGITPGEIELQENLFRNYYHNSRNSLKYKFEECLPAYEYGRLIATDPRFWKLSWEEIEPLVRQEWEKSERGTWEDFRESVRYMWEGNIGQSPRRIDTDEKY